ncbi:PREDICTED: TATA box-binding protein-associated factor RNA polymerase I subunit A isoform X2 [Cercocebus atys]|uniref:TATA-box binding protein associated factor, RNA polymerase I subunit A n=1 Tax=Cercocebus atys TaxID=9531 RepID=A0A2K5LPL6_CERAT|nr:PREDICTED: TATA box-binding protein-associated factor RNA polymerase I subunit A isoform X2 [Cercocebus atys]XP_011896021.1 PREDICTED: TATA box-binding protein-associated factor RNA polymerase I subunit A isoform X2 [Cercocebus atys]
MSDFSEELKGPVTDDEVETSVLTGAGMHFPWLQTYVETVAIGGKRKKDFAQTTSACLSFVQEALLKHQWQQAAEYMYSYFQTLEDSDSYKRQAAPEISLQHALYLLHHGMLKDAKRNLSEAETWRHGENTSSRGILINLIQAYKGLLQYYTWSKKKMELSKLDKDDYAYNAVAQDVFNHSWKTSANISALIKIPGVWDPFVKSYVEMLEFYGDRDGAQEVLTNYAYDEKFPSNPNAHIYLYNFLKRQKAPRSKMISVLKILYQIVPSHKLMLEFHTLLRKSEKEEHHKLGLEVLFGVLDFAGCTKNITAWKYLAKYLKKTLMGNHLAWVQDEWNSRKNWWPSFHFSYFWAKSDWKEDTALACEKAFVAGLLLGKGCRYFRYILKQDHQILGKKIKQMKRSVKKYSIVNPRLSY